MQFSGSQTERPYLRPLHLECKTSLEDLDTSLYLNKIILQEVLQKKSITEDQTELGMISHKILSGITIDNERINDSIKRMQMEIKEAEINIKKAEDNISQSRKRKKDYLKNFDREMEKIRSELWTKEEQIREVEKYSVVVNEAYQNYLVEESEHPEKILQETFNMMNKANELLKNAENSQKHEVSKCLKLEKKIQYLRKNLKVAEPVYIKTTQGILNKNYFIAPKIADIFAKTQVTYQSEDLDSVDEFGSFSRSDLKIEKIMRNGKASRNKAGDLTELEIVHKVISEEIVNMTRVLNELESIDLTLASTFSNL